MNNVVVDAAAAEADTDAEEINLICLNCNGVINENTYCILFNCEHGIHVNCLNEYMENERILCSECNLPISLQIVQNIPEARIKRRSLNEIVEDVSKLYKEDKEYKKEIDDCNKLLVKIKRLQNEIFGKSEIAKKKEISTQSKFYRKIITNRKMEFIKSLKKEKEKECKELGNLCRQFNKKEKKISEKYNRNDFRAYLEYKTRRYICVYKFYEYKKVSIFLRHKLGYI